MSGKGTQSGISGNKNRVISLRRGKGNLDLDTPTWRQVKRCICLARRALPWGASSRTELTMVLVPQQLQRFIGPPVSFAG